MSRESNQPDENPKIPAFAIAAVALALDPPFCPSPSTSSGRAVLDRTTAWSFFVELHNEKMPRCACCAAGRSRRLELVARRDIPL